MREITITKSYTRPVNADFETRAIVDKDTCYILYQGTDAQEAERIANLYRNGKWCNVARGFITHLDIDVYHLNLV